MSQHEYRDMLPGHADFTLPKPAAPVRLNGRRPIPEVPQMNGHPEGRAGSEREPDAVDRKSVV